MPRIILRLRLLQTGYATKNVLLLFIFPDTPLGDTRSVATVIVCPLYRGGVAGGGGALHCRRVWPERAVVGGGPSRPASYYEQSFLCVVFFEGMRAGGAEWIRS